MGTLDEDCKFESEQFDSREEHKEMETSLIKNENEKPSKVSLRQRFRNSFKRKRKHKEREDTTHNMKNSDNDFEENRLKKRKTSFIFFIFSRKIKRRRKSKPPLKIPSDQDLSVDKDENKCETCDEPTTEDLNINTNTTTGYKTVEGIYNNGSEFQSVNNVGMEAETICNVSRAGSMDASDCHKDISTLTSEDEKLHKTPSLIRRLFSLKRTSKKKLQTADPDFDENESQQKIETEENSFKIPNKSVVTFTADTTDNSNNERKEDGVYMNINRCSLRTSIHVNMDLSSLLDFVDGVMDNNFHNDDPDTVFDNTLDLQNTTNHIGVAKIEVPALQESDVIFNSNEEELRSLIRNSIRESLHLGDGNEVVIVDDLTDYSPPQSVIYECFV